MHFRTPPDRYKGHGAYAKKQTACHLRYENNGKRQKMDTIRAYAKLMRVHHYIKNILVFAALGCSGQLFCLDKLRAALAGFAAFCMVSSVVYIVNDIRDAERDRRHPAKQNRPIASGKISARNGCILVIVLLATAAVCHALAFCPAAAALPALYVALNLGYSFGLKDLPLVDVAILASGFLLRMMYGAVITHVHISNWLYLMVIDLAFYFSLGKRRNELRRIADGTTRKVLACYSLDFLDKSMHMCLTLANVFYALWCMDASTIFHYGTSLVFTVPIVLLATMRYSMDVERESDGDPVEVLLGDWVLMALCLACFLTLFVILYF